jgi:hypothetical protein
MLQVACDLDAHGGGLVPDRDPSATNDLKFVPREPCVFFQRDSGRMSAERASCVDSLKETEAVTTPGIG